MNLNIDWVTLFWGVTLALLLINFWNLFKAYTARSRARKELIKVAKKLATIKQELVKEKDAMSEQIKQEKK